MSTASCATASTNRTPVFRNPADGRLRAGWRIAGFLLCFYALALPLLFGGRAAFDMSRRSPLIFVLIAVAATLAVAFARRRFDRQTWVSLGFRLDRRTAPDLLFGFALSGLMAGCVFLAMLALGYVTEPRVTMSGPELVTLLAGPLAITAVIAYWEELVFRGYLLQNMADGMGMTRAVLVSCLIYGVVHATNPSATLLSSAIIVLFGYLRIYGYLGTKQLWLSMGMHWGWNFFQATVFGYAASGHAEEHVLIEHGSAGPDWLSGGAFGPEGSVLTVPVVLVALLAMRAWSRRQCPVSRS